MTRVPMIDLQAQYAGIQDEIQEAIGRVLASQRFILGDEVRTFESELASYLGLAHVVGMSSGTDALLAALMALDLRTGDEVVTTAFTFLSTVEAIVRAGARPVLVDIAPGSFHFDVAAVQRALTVRTRAIVAVHLFGGCADLTDVRTLADARGIALIEDAAQAIGASRRGQRAGAYGTAASLSFFPSKNLGAYGDAGAVLTSSSTFAEVMSQIRNHGQAASAKYATVRLGGNFRLDALQAAILRVKLRHLDRWNERRRQIAAFYLGNLPENDDLVLPRPERDEEHVFHQFVLRTSRRDALRAHLAAEGVETEVHYPRPMHEQAAWRVEDAYPHAERASREVVSLPVYPELRDEQVERVVRLVTTWATD